MGLAPLNGSSPTVGVIGYTLGGGLGPMVRTFGFAADRVRRLQLVTAEGAIIEVDAEHESELFWGLCGGKPEVGIVTEVEFDLLDVPDYYGGAIFYPAQAAHAVLHTFAQWAPTLPEHSTASIALLRLPDVDGVPEPLRGKLSVHLRFVHIGPDAEGSHLLAPMRAVASPVLDLVTRTPYSEIASVHQDPVDPLPAWDRGIQLRELSAKAIDTLLAMAGPAVEVPLIVAEIRHLGGAATRCQGTPNAVGGRDAAYSLGLVAPYPPPLRDTVNTTGTAILDAMAPWATGSSPVNFLGHATSPAEVRRAWSAATVVRLQSLKQTRDPAGRFRFGYSITD